MNSDIKIHPIGKCQFFNQKQKRRKKNYIQNDWFHWYIITIKTSQC